MGFAFGAAIGATLPSTDQEDAIIGDTASSVKKTLMAEADKAMDKGGELASQALKTAESVASDVRDVAKDRISEEVARLSSSQQDNGTFRPH